MKQIFDLVGSTLASSVRSWRGTSASRSTQQPEREIILFDREGCAECRQVREVITELNLDVIIAPCPLGGENIKALHQESGSDVIPKLVDTNTEEARTGAAEIIRYLYLQYKGCEPKAKASQSLLNAGSSKLASLLRFNSGIYAKPSRPASEALTLYSFESSPFSRPVRELLCELELPYKLVTLGKQQKSDMGPAKARWTLKPYQPLKNTKRDAFFKKHGDVQVPFLQDPNTGAELFESKDILSYLKQRYQKGRK